MANVGDETDVHGIRTVLEGQEEREVEREKKVERYRRLIESEI